MTESRNPYQKNNFDTLLIRKNYLNMKPAAKQNLCFDYSQVSLKANQETANSFRTSSQSALNNPFVSNHPYRNGQTHSYNQVNFQSQPYLKFLQNKNNLSPVDHNQSKNPQKFLSLNSNAHRTALNKSNLATSSVSSMQNSMHEYNNLASRYYAEQFQKNNDWNTEMWRRQLQKQQRNNLKKYGFQALRYDDQFKKNGFNNYYSYGIPSQNKFENNFYTENEITRNNYRNLKQSKTDKQSTPSKQQQQQNPQALYQKKNLARMNSISDIHQQSQQNQDSKISSLRLARIQTNEYKNANKLQKRSSANDSQEFFHDESQWEAQNFTSQIQGRDSAKMPLNLESFDNIRLSKSPSNRQKSSESKPPMYKNKAPPHTKTKNGEQLVLKHMQQDQYSSILNPNEINQGLIVIKNKPESEQDFPRKLKFKNKIYYRIKFIEDKKN